MKKPFPYSLTAIIILAVVLFGCGITYTGVSFTMVDVPSQSYEIAQTEVTYELWYAVKAWAVDNGYQFTKDADGKDITGSEGSIGMRGAVPTANNQHPVTFVSWRDAMVWCNALTEYYAAKGGTSYKCVYCSDPAYTTPIRTSTRDGVPTPIPAGSQDEPYINPDAKGFRLPFSDEWYQAARYIDGSTVYPDNYASGATGPYTNTDATKAVAWYSAVAWYLDNSGSSTHIVGIAGSQTPTTPKTGNANALGLYDMSGNVWEWCFDWYPGHEGSYRVLRGGSWKSGVLYLQLGMVSFEYPGDAVISLGFRPVRTQ